MTPEPTAAPRFAAALSTLADARAAAAEAAKLAKAQLGAAPHLAMVFVSFDHQEHFAALAETLREELGIDCILGCTGESIVGNDREIEGSSAVSLWLAHLPGVHLVPMYLEFEMTGDGGSFVGWPDELAEPWPDDSSLVVLADPFSFPADVLLSRLEQEHPKLGVAGGMASGGWGPGQNRLILGGRTLDKGAVAVRIDGPVRLRHVVSQGCRPIGKPFVITKAERNVIFELGGRPALVQLQELYGELSEADRQLARGGLHVGRVIDEYREGFARGDFLVRNVQGADTESGAVAIGDFVRAGQTVQFHVRDAQTADEDLHALLSAARESGANSAGALLFTCNGRGTRLFAEPHHDAATLSQYWPNLPVAGFFAQGEIGPIGGKNFVHGFTASIALFEPAASK
jgi:small ligand-binding sensory domain FIST